MRYLVTAKVKPGRAVTLLKAIKKRTLGLGSIAGSEYLRDMAHARQLEDGRVRWVEVCYAQRHWKRSDRIGKNISTWSKLKMPTTVAVAGI